MGEFLAFGLRNIFVALLQWCAIFVGATLAASLPAMWWSIHRARRSGPGGASFAWLVLILGLFITAPLIALFHAVPYAAERSLAEMMRGSRSREAVDWIVSITADHLATTLNVEAPSTRVNVRELKTQVAEAVRQAREMLLADERFGEVQSMLTEKSLAALEATLDQMPVRNGTVVWSELVDKMKTVMGEQSVATFADTSAHLDRIAAANLRFTYVAVGVCNAVTLLLVALAARPKAALQPGAPAGV